MPSLHLFSAGSNARGQLATGFDEDAHTFQPAIFLGDHPADSIPPGTAQLLQMACGANHTLALLLRNSEDGATRTEIWGCGDGRRGQLGLKWLTDAPALSSAERPSPSSSVFHQIQLPCQHSTQVPPEYSPRLIAAGWETSYVVLSCTGRTDLLLAMGANDYGNLGRGGKCRDAGAFWHLIHLEELLRQPSLVTVESLSTGPHSVIMRLRSRAENEEVLVRWGASRHGQLGDFSTTSKPPVFLSTPQCLSLPPGAETLGKVTVCALGTQHTALLHDSGRITGLGSTRKGQLQGLADLRGVRSMLDGR